MAPPSPSSPPDCLPSTVYHLWQQQHVTNSPTQQQMHHLPPPSRCSSSPKHHAQPCVLCMLPPPSSPSPSSPSSISSPYLCPPLSESKQLPPAKSSIVFKPDSACGQKIEGFPEILGVFNPTGLGNPSPAKNMLYDPPARSTCSTVSLINTPCHRRLLLSTTRHISWRVSRVSYEGVAPVKDVPCCIYAGIAQVDPIDDGPPVLESMRL